MSGNNYSFMVEQKFVNISDRTKLEKLLKKDYRCNKKLVVEKLTNAYILPYNKETNGGVVGEDKTYYKHSHLHRGGGTSYSFDNNDVTRINEDVVYLGMFFNLWGHCITDELKLLWFLLDTDYQFLKNCKLVYIPMQDFKFSENFSYILNKLGLDTSKLIPITTITQFNHVYLPDDCFVCDDSTNLRYYTDEYLNLINFITNDIYADTTYSKIYFTRTGLKNKKDTGEKYIENVFREMGYKVISPEKLSFEQQVSLLKGCNYFATTEGSCAHNALFMNEGSNIIIIRKASYINEYQLCIDFAKKLDVTYIDSYYSTLAPKNYEYFGPFFLYQSKFLSEYFGLKYKGFPFFYYLFSYRLYFFLRKIYGRIRRLLKI